MTSPKSEPDRTPDLCPQDAALLDRLVDAGFDRDRLGELTADERSRVDRMLAHFTLLDAYPDPELSAEDADTLVAATLARIQRADEERTESLKIEHHPAYSGAGGGGRFRWSDLIAVACVLIVGVSLAVPMVRWSRGQSLKTSCANNLRLVASGIEAYAGDFSSLPMRASLLPDFGNWSGYRHSDNLRSLSDHEYVGANCLCCPGDQDPDSCYAYQVMAAARHPHWNRGPTIPLVGDRNPLIDLERNGKTIGNVALNSESHDGAGQNLLFSDGSIRFLLSPYVTPSGQEVGRGDNIWLPYGESPDALRRRPTGDVDAFLLH